MSKSMFENYVVRFDDGHMLTDQGSLTFAVVDAAAFPDYTAAVSFALSLGYTIDQFIIYPLWGSGGLADLGYTPS